MQGFRQNLDARGEARTGARKVAVGFQRVNAAIANRRDCVPLVREVHGVVFVAALLGAVAARRNENDVRRGFHDVLQGDTERGLARAAENVDTAGTLEHFGHPMAADVKRLQPFEEGHPRVTRNILGQVFDLAEFFSNFLE